MVKTTTRVYGYSLIYSAIFTDEHPETLAMIKFWNKKCHEMTIPFLNTNFDRKRTCLKQGLGVFDIRNIDGLVQDCSIFIATALEILQFCTKPSFWEGEVLMTNILFSHRILPSSQWRHMSFIPPQITGKSIVGTRTCTDWQQIKYTNTSLQTLREWNPSVSDGFHP